MQLGQNIARVVVEPLELVPNDRLADLVLGHLALAALAAVGVLGLDHLIDVLHLQLDLVLVGAGRAPVEQVGARTGVEPREQHEQPDDDRDAAQHYERKCVHESQRQSNPRL